MSDIPTIPDLHHLALALGWPKEEVHSLLHDGCLMLWPECQSLTDLSPEQRIIFAAQLRACGGRMTVGPPRRKSSRSRRGRPTEPGVIRMASPAQKQLLKSLASEMRWTESLLNGFLKTHFQVDGVDGLTTTAQACKAIQMLKAYKCEKERKAGSARRFFGAQ
jgi:hypothetical protein